MSSLALNSLLLLVSVAAVCDMRTRRVPNALTVTACLFGFVIGLSTQGLSGLIAALAGTLTGLALLMPGFLLRFTGGGDVKLLAAVGSIAGAARVLDIFVVSVLLGACAVLVWGAVICARQSSFSPLRRYTDMVRLFFATGRPSYVRPQPGEFAATRVPLAPILALGTISVCFDLITINRLL